MPEMKGERPKQPMPEHEDPTHKGVTSGGPDQKRGIPQGATENNPAGRPTPDRKETEVAADKQGGAGTGKG